MPAGCVFDSSHPGKFQVICCLCYTRTFFIRLFDVLAFPGENKNSCREKVTGSAYPFCYCAAFFFNTCRGPLPPVFILGKDASPFPFYVFWLFLLLVITPVCWLFYLLGKDKIARCRNMEAALARSTADLQFLRSQINPHFLFNALNTLYGTALKESAEHTAEGSSKAW